MSERRPAGQPNPALRRGPPAPDPEIAATSWRDGEPPVLAEHRGSFADADADAAYRWAAVAAADRDVLDVGCGAGHGAPILLGGGARSVLGTDHDERSVEIATGLHGERARFIVAEPAALPFAPASFGLVTCFAALESSPEPEAILEQFRSLCAEGGLLAVSLPTEPPLDPISGAPLTAQRDAVEWGRLLGERFANVRTYRRRSSFAASVLPGEAEPEIDRISWLGADRGEERSVLAIAGDGELPDMPAVATLVGSRDLRAYRDTIAAWEQRARRAEADGAAKHWELVASREAQRRLRKRLYKLEHGPLRKLARVLRGKPARLGEGPPIRPPELEPEPWD